VQLLVGFCFPLFIAWIVFILSFILRYLCLSVCLFVCLFIVVEFVYSV